METILQDLRYCVRAAFRNPGFTAVVILSLGLGIGANTSIFSAINAVLLRPLPFKDPDRLMMVYRTDKQPQEAASPWSYPKFEALRDNSDAFEQVAAVSLQNFPLTETEAPERLQVEMVSASYFPLLGIDAARGRTFLPEEDFTPGTHPVVILSHGLWQRRFGSDPGVIGQSVSLNKVPLTVIGVLPEGFKGQTGQVDAWVPMMMAPQLTFPRRLKTAGAHWHEVIARLKPEVSESQARAEMDVLNDKIAAANPGQPNAEAIRVAPLKEAKIDPAIRKSFLILLAAVAFVLLIACANIASLLLAKAASRRKEIALRLALGASRSRVVRQLLTESVALALAGGVVGLLLSLWGVELLTAINPMSDPASRARYELMLDFHLFEIDRQVLAFNLLLSLITGVLFGLAPALQASRPDLNEALKESSAASAVRAGSLRRLNFRSALVVAEVALSLVLLVSAGLMIRSFARLQATDIGFDPDQVITAKINLPREYYGQRAAAFFEQLLTRVAQLPGVQSATAAISTPLSTNSSKALMRTQGQQLPEEAGAAVGYHIVAPGHFETLKIPLLKGRAFTDQDRDKSPRVAIVSQAAASRHWPNEDALGKRIWLSVGWAKDDFAEVIGVAGDVKYGNVEKPVEPDVYIPYLQSEEPPSFIIARATNDAAALGPALRQTVLSLDKNVPTYDVKTMRERSLDATSKTRFSALLLGVFAAMALALSSIGIYGVISYSVAGRTREIGIRMALGAKPGDVLRLVVGDGLALTVAGLALGIAGAFAATRVLASQLYGVEAGDPATFALVSLLLAATALAASYIPARRAARVDPMIALRHE